MKAKYRQQQVILSDTDESNIKRAEFYQKLKDSCELIVIHETENKAVFLTQYDELILDGSKIKADGKVWREEIEKFKQRILKKLDITGNSFDKITII